MAGWIDKNPAAGVSIPRQTKAMEQRHVFDLDDVRRYLQAAEPQHVAMLATVAGITSRCIRGRRSSSCSLSRMASRWGRPRPTGGTTGRWPIWGCGPQRRSGADYGGRVSRYRRRITSRCTTFVLRTPRGSSARGTRSRKSCSCWGGATRGWRLRSTARLSTPGRERRPQAGRSAQGPHSRVA